MAEEVVHLAPPVDEEGAGRGRAVGLRGRIGLSRRGVSRFAGTGGKVGRATGGERVMAHVGFDEGGSGHAETGHYANGRGSVHLLRSDIAAVSKVAEAGERSGRRVKHRVKITGVVVHS
jgi:hypothetical protein